jgi:hypothetical protein
MQRKTNNNNFYGIERFRSSPLSSKTKNELCKYIYIVPKISAEDGRIIANTYVTEEHAHKLLSRLRKEANELSKRVIKIKTLNQEKMINWIELNGFLSIEEIIEFCEYCQIDATEYYEKLEVVKSFLVTKSGKLYFKYLEHYNEILDETQINWALDKYLEHENENVKEVV